MPNFRQILDVLKESGGNDTNDATIMLLLDASVIRVLYSFGIQLTSAQIFLIWAILRGKEFDHMMEGDRVRYCAATRWHHRTACGFPTTSKLIPAACFTSNVQVLQHVHVQSMLKYKNTVCDLRRMYPRSWQQQNVELEALQLPSQTSKRGHILKIRIRRLLM